MEVKQINQNLKLQRETWLFWVLESIPLSFSVEKREDRWVCQICLLPHLDFAACLLRRGLRQSRGFVTW